MTGYTSGLISINQPGATRWSYEVYDAFDVVNVPDDNVFDSAWTCTIQAAINAAREGGTINVAAGTYNERLTIDKSVDLRGAQYGVAPTPIGARITPADESVITEAGLPTPNPDVLIEIPTGVFGVTVDGFTLNGDQANTIADTSVVRIWGDNRTISNNIIDGMFGVIYKGGETLTVHQNRMVVNKVGVAVQPNPATNVTISDNIITLGSNPVGDEQGIYMTGCSQCSVTGNTATGFVNAKGVAGSNLDRLTVSGNAFTGNKDALSFWGNTTFVTISNNVLSNSLRYGISIKGQDITITGNQIANNGDVGINIDRHVIDTERITISENTITGNGTGIQLNGSATSVSIVGNDILNNVSDTGVLVKDGAAAENEAHLNNIVGNDIGIKNEDLDDTFDAECNWWGATSGPTHVSNPDGTGDAVSDNVDYDPWLKAPSPYPLFAMASFVIDHAKIDFKKKPDDDKVRVSGKLELDLDCGNGVDISEDVIVTVGPLSETIKMVAKGKEGETWQYERPKGDTGDIKHMTINWKNGEFDIRMDKADLTDLTDPNNVTISIQIGDDLGEETILMREKKDHWDYKAK